MSFFAKDTFHISLVGRTNTGKSTLYNRLVGKSFAIEGAEAHLTRDIRIHRVENMEFADCPGIEPLWFQKAKQFPVERELIDTVLSQSHLIIWVVDGRCGFMPEDMDIFNIFKRYKCPWIGVFNKMDHDRALLPEAGPRGTWLPVSSSHKLGLSELMDEIQALNDKRCVAEPQQMGEKQEAFKLVCIGRTNAGKSSFCNQALGFSRVQVSPEAHTTRDVIEFSWQLLNDRPMVLMDTAGLLMTDPSKYAKTKTLSVSVLQARRGIERSDLAFFFVDATVGLKDLDLHIYELIRTAYTTVIIVVNKWDAEDRVWKTQGEARETIHAKTAYPHHVLFHSTFAPFKKKLFQRLIESIILERNREIPTHEINAWLREFRDTSDFDPIHRVISLKYGTQKGTDPIRVYFFGKQSKKLTPPTLRQIKKTILRSFFKAFEIRYGPVFFSFRKQ